MLRFTAIIFTYFILLYSLFAQNTYSIKGKILSDLPIKQLQAIPVVLLKFQPESTPPMFPVTRSKTNEKGEYLFENIKATQKEQYLIGALILGNRISSEVVTLNNQKIQTINMEFFNPENNKNISFDLNAIEYTNRLLIFHLVKNFIRITEIIQLQNNSNQIISSQKQPLHIVLPEKYQNFASFKIKEENLTSIVQENKALLTFEVPPAQSDLYFEYDLPFDKEYTYFHPPFSGGTIPLSILFDKRYLEITTLGNFLEFDQHERYTIGSFVINPQEKIQINIRSKITSKKLFWYLGSIFALLIICSLLVFSWRWHKQSTHI